MGRWGYVSHLRGFLKEGMKRAMSWNVLDAGKVCPLNNLDLK